MQLARVTNQTLRTLAQFPLLRVGVVAAGLLTLTGCGGEDLGVDSEFTEAEDAVIGGTETTAQPQVGMYRIAGAGFCTGTLITPQWFVTAAHCVPKFDYSNGGQFQITRLVAGKSKIYSYNIDRVYALGEDLRDYDVAIGRLVSAVPASIATPARISSSHPVPGEPVAMFGYGGLNAQSDPANQGTKRYAQITWASDPDNLSKGDSGGPQLRGTLFWGLMVANGEVVASPEVIAVNSGFQNHLLRKHDYDFYGYPSRMKHLIEELIRDVDGDLEIGIDRYGMDFAHFDFNMAQTTPLQAAQTCLALCKGVSKCRSFSFVKSWGRCFLKDATARAVPNDDVISGVVGGFEPGVNRPGGDYRSFNLSSASPISCANSCAQDWQCRSWTYVPPGSGSSVARCWLKDRISDPVRSTQSGGGTVITSGVRMGFEYNRYNLGHTYRSFGMGNNPFPDVCQAQCEKESQCTTWMYRPLTQFNSGATCELKDTSGSTFTSIQTVSGSKGKAFQR